MSKGAIPELPAKYPVKDEIYQHYKGDLYRPLYEDADAEMFTRPLAEWFENVTWNHRDVERFSLATKEQII
jgi:hypothetical protein